MSNCELSNEEIEIIHEDQAYCNNPEIPLAEDESESVSIRMKYLLYHYYIYLSNYRVHLTVLLLKQ